MRDPLQPVRSPYEVLGLERDATRDQIRAAFVGAMKRDPQGAADARRTLGDPKRRILVDLFEYDPRIFSRLRITPESNMLTAPYRGETLRLWEEICRAQFPDIQLTHALAVFWYWWLDHIYRELQRDVNFTLPASSPLPIMFERLFACWAMLLTDTAFWNFPGHMQTETTESIDSAEVKQAVCERLLRLIRQMAALFETRDKIGGKNIDQKSVEHKSVEHKTRRDGGVTRLRNIEICERLYAMESLLGYEQHAARLTQAADIQTSSGRKIACGWLMLFYMQQLESTREALDTVIRTSAQDDPSLVIRQRAREALSPTGYARYLLQQATQNTEEQPLRRGSISGSKSESNFGSQEEGEIHHALRLLDSDPVAVETWDRKQLRAEILLALGRQEMQERAYSKAIEHWGEAFSLAEAELRTEIRQVMVALCQERAESWRTANPDRAIDLLEQALRHLDSPVVRSVQGRLLYDRALSRLTSIQNSIASGAITAPMALGLLRSCSQDIATSTRFLPGDTEVRALATSIQEYQAALQPTTVAGKAGSELAPSLPASPIATAPGGPSPALPTSTKAGNSGCLLLVCYILATVFILHIFHFV